MLSHDFARELIESFEADKAKSRHLAAKDLKRRSFISKGFDQFLGLFRTQL